jgi:hypothetical protein
MRDRLASAERPAFSFAERARSAGAFRDMQALETPAPNASDAIRTRLAELYSAIVQLLHWGGGI